MNDNNAKEQHLKDGSPTTIKLATIFIGSVVYFISEHYFLASEYYVNSPPYLIISIISLMAIFYVFRLLKKKEPERKDSHLYAIIVAIGVALFLYSFIPRINVIWVADDNISPSIRLYSKLSKFWQEFKPGDKYFFEIRRGGLGVWLVNMDRVYAEQKEYYDCNTYMNCAKEGWKQTINKLRE